MYSGGPKRGKEKFNDFRNGDWEGTENHLGATVPLSRHPGTKEGQNWIVLGFSG